MKIFRCLVLACLTMVFSIAAFATHVEINFDDQSQCCVTGPVITNQYAAEGATFSSSPGNVNYITTQPSYMSTPPNFICTGPVNSSINCLADTYVNFSSGVNNLNFDAMGVNNPSGVVAMIDVYTNGSFNSTVDVIAGGQGFAPDHIDLSGFSNITEIHIYNITDAGGIGWDTFQYDINGSTPEPASLMLMGSGVLGLAGILRRRFSR